MVGPTQSLVHMVLVEPLCSLSNTASVMMHTSSSTLYPLGIISFLVIVVPLVMHVLSSRRLDLDLLPSPPAVLLLGHIQLALHVKDMHLQFLRWHNRFGKLLRIRVLQQDMVLIADPALASEVLTLGPNYCARRPADYATFNVVSFSGCTTVHVSPWCKQAIGGL